jgi:excisionase family DNA binding protein
MWEMQRMNSSERNIYLTTKEVAKLLKINDKMVYTLITEKGLPATKVTGKWLFPQKLVEEWLDVTILDQQPSEFLKTSLSDNNKLLLAGSDDPLFQQTLALFNKKSNGRVAFFANLGSMGGLKCLRWGLCHIGVCHLLQDDNQEYNFNYAERELSRLPVFVNFSKREQGILLQKGNPKKILSIADLAQPEVRIVNRPLGTGTRLLLDYEITKCGISTDKLIGYDKEMTRHIDVGLEILAGKADAGPAIRAVAGLLNLDFMPLRWERFDLLIARERFFDQGIQDFINLMQDRAFHKLAKTFIGYDLSLCGKMVFPDNLNNKE